MKYLPKKPSRLIQLALEDLAVCETDPRYEICMGAWHGPVGGICLVCLAGATMARLGATPDKTFNHQSFGKVNRSRFLALNFFRTGRINDAFVELGIKRPRGIGAQYAVPSYEFDPAGFKRALVRIFRRLEKLSF